MAQMMRTGFSALDRLTGGLAERQGYLVYGNAQEAKSALALAFLASGIANGICNPSIHSISTLRIPPAIRPKAMAAQGTIWGLGLPLGLVVAGPVLSTFGARPVLIGFAAVQTVCMLGVAFAALRVRGRVSEPVPAG